MTALYIIGGIAAVIALILLISVKLNIRFSGDDFDIFIKIGPVKISLTKNKKINIKKTAKKLRGKKLSEPLPMKKKTAKSKEKEKSRSVFGQLKDMIAESCGENGKIELLYRLFEFIKAVAKKFMSKVDISIKRLKVGVDCGDAHSTAVTCGVLWQAAAALIDTVGSYTNIKSCPPEAISFEPVFNDGKFIYDISVKIKVRVGSIVSTALSAFAAFIKMYISGKSRQNISISKKDHVNNGKTKG